MLCLSFSHTHTSLAASVVSPLLLAKKGTRASSRRRGGTLRFSWTKARDAVPFRFFTGWRKTRKREKIKKQKKSCGFTGCCCFCGFVTKVSVHQDELAVSKRQRSAIFNRSSAPHSSRHTGTFVDDARHCQKNEAMTFIKPVRPLRNATCGSFPFFFFFLPSNTRFLLSSISTPETPHVEISSRSVTRFWKNRQREHRGACRPKTRNALRGPA